MWKILFLWFARLFAGKIAGRAVAWIGAGLGVAVGEGFAWLVAHLPIVAQHVDPQQVVIWLTTAIVAPLINHLGNWAFQSEKGKDAGVAAAIKGITDEVAADLVAKPPVPVAKAQPVNKQ